MDLNTMSLPELRRLQSRVSGEIQRRSETTRRNFLKKMKKMASDEGVSLSEVIDEIAQSESRGAAGTRKRRVRPAEKKTGAKKSGKLPPKYRHPELPGVGWSGHGRRPQWIIDWLAQNKPLEELETSAGR